MYDFYVVLFYKDVFIVNCNFDINYVDGDYICLYLVKILLVNKKELYKGF